MKVTQVLKMEVLAVLAQMAVDGQLDGDISGLDIDEVFDKAVENMRDTSDSFVTQMHQVEALGDFIMEPTRDSWNKLKEAQTLGKGMDLADDYVDMVERYENAFTVDGLLEEVEP